MNPLFNTDYAEMEVRAMTLMQDMNLFQDLGVRTEDLVHSMQNASSYISLYGAMSGRIANRISNVYEIRREPVDDNILHYTKGEFEAMLPEGWEEILAPDDWMELIYDIPTKRKNITIRIYSCITKQNNRTPSGRWKTVRIIFWNCVDEKALSEQIKIPRKIGRNNLMKRIAIQEKMFFSGAFRKPKKPDMEREVDWEYVKRILNAVCVGTYNQFAESLLDGLNRYGTLTDNQMKYVLGDKNPYGKPTLEAQVLLRNPNFNKSKEEKSFENIEEIENTEIQMKANEAPEFNMQKRNGGPTIEMEWHQEAVVDEELGPVISHRLQPTRPVGMSIAARAEFREHSRIRNRIEQSRRQRVAREEAVQARRDIHEARAQSTEGESPTAFATRIYNSDD